MFIKGKRILEYSKEDLISLVDNKVPESRTLEFKRVCKLSLEQDKVEFISDINSFYNTDGGCIVFGLEEEQDGNGLNTGIATFPAVSIKVSNYDQLKLQIEECIKQTTNPQIVNLVFSELFEINSSHVFILGIPKSTSMPSMITYKNLGRFFRRKSSGKYQLDTYELFDMFTRNLALEQEVSEYVQTRTKEILSDQFFPGISSDKGVLMHLIPVSYFHENIDGFNETVFADRIARLLRPPGDGGYNRRYCFEGIHMYNSLSSAIPVKRYCLLRRNGTIEAYSNELIRPVEKQPPMIFAETFLSYLADHIKNCFSFYRQQSISPPYLLSVLFNNVRGFDLVTQESQLKVSNWKKDHFEFPSFLLFDDIESTKSQIKQIADVLWQTCGVNECPPEIFEKHARAIFV